jgi:hypothetical protein
MTLYELALNIGGGASFVSDNSLQQATRLTTGAWRCTWLGDIDLTEDQADRAMAIADTIGDTIPTPDDETWQLISTLRTELGIDTTVEKLAFFAARAVPTYLAPHEDHPDPERP